jgi:hypothetical protein
LPAKTKKSSYKCGVEDEERNERKKMKENEI